jgi:ATP-dependent HslUV protease subunit HslV
MSEQPGWRGTTILCVRKNSKVVIAGDGQVTTGATILKANARKVRPLAGGDVIAGFAGATADAFALFERLEEKLERFPKQLSRACVELAKDWRTERALRRLDAMLVVADRKETYLISGAGDVVDPEHQVIAVGSGGNYALAAARAVYDHLDDAEDIARKAMEIAAEICVYTNRNLTLLTLTA